MLLGLAWGLPGQTPMSAAGKLSMGVRDSVVPSTFLVSGMVAGATQVNNTNPSLGQGAEGFGRRFGLSMSDRALGNVLTEGAFPALLGHDPRYVRRGQGSVLGRTGYALKRIVVARTDRGGRSFNVSEFAGNGIAAAIGNVYYPDQRSAAYTAQRLGFQLAADAFSNIFTEFLPDLKRKFRRH